MMDLALLANPDGHMIAPSIVETTFDAHWLSGITSHSHYSMSEGLGGTSSKNPNDKLKMPSGYPSLG